MHEYAHYLVFDTFVWLSSEIFLMILLCGVMYTVTLIQIESPWEAV